MIGCGCDVAASDDGHAARFVERADLLLTLLFGAVGDMPVRPEPIMLLSETPNDYLVSADLMGLEAADVDVVFDDDVLVIRGRAGPRRGSATSREDAQRHPTFVERRIALPLPVDATSTATCMSNGVLTARITKRRRDGAVSAPPASPDAALRSA